MSISEGLASSSAGLLGRICLHPLDTAKARLQSPNGGEFKNTLHVLRVAMTEEGVKGLYRGFGAVALGGTPGTCIYLTTYEALKRHFLAAPLMQDEGNHFLAYSAAGMLAEAACCIVYTPVDIVKERLQIQRPPEQALKQGNTAMRSATNYTGSWNALTTIAASEGVIGLYKGYWATLASFGPYSALYFVLYEKLKTHWTGGSPPPGTREGSFKAPAAQHQAEIPFVVSLSQAAAASAIASWATNPLDLAKLRLQVQRAKTGSAGSVTAVSCTRYTGMLHVLISVFKSGGFPALFKGSGARVLFATPFTAVCMATYERFKLFWGRIIDDT
ncbi:unnamed protein product [Chrysoparadoxa australica]